MTDQTPESRSRELAKGFDVRVGPKETRAPRWGATLELVRRMFNAHEAAFIAFHDPALITAYADVVEAARDYEGGDCFDHEANCCREWCSRCATASSAGQRLSDARSRLDALARDRGEGEVLSTGRQVIAENRSVLDRLVNEGDKA